MFTNHCAILCAPCHPAEQANTSPINFSGDSTTWVQHYKKLPLIFKWVSVYKKILK